MDTNPTPPRAWILPAAIAVSLGAIAWLLAAVVTGKKEPWDTGAYWSAIYPVSLLGAAALAWAWPRGAWRWPPLVFFGHLVGASLHAGEVSNLWPIALAMFLALSLPGVALCIMIARFRKSSGA